MAQSTFTMLDSNGQNWQVSINTSGDFVATPVATVGTTPGIVPAGSYTPSDAITQNKVFVGNLPTTTTQYIACDLVQSIIWTLFPWNWTVNTLTNISLVDGQQDYSHSQTDFYRFVNLELNLTSNSPNVVRAITQKQHLSQELITKGGIDTIRFFSWEPNISKIRLDYPASIPSGTTIVIQGNYQFLPTKITSSNFSTALNLPDHYFPVYVAGVLWQLYDLNNDPRAGTAQVVRGEKVYTGQLGKFHDLLLQMKAAEDFSDGEDLVYPAGGTLGIGRESSVPRIFL